MMDDTTDPRVLCGRLRTLILDGGSVVAGDAVDALRDLVSDLPSEIKEEIRDA